MRLLNILFFILFFLNSIFAQPVADFIIQNNTTSGCGFLSVDCQNTSTNFTGTPTYKWEFSDNPNSVSLKDAVHLFTNDGNYTIKLTVTDINGSSSKTQNVTVYKTPEVQFNANVTKGCFPLTVQFSDLTVAGTGKINSWSWSFGNGGGSNQQNPTYLYNNTIGSFDVSLEVVDENNCRNSLTKTGYINPLSKPNPTFTTPVKYFCDLPANPVCFTNTTAGSNLSFLWDFGNGITSHAKDTCIKYNSTGNSFDVSLTAINDGACSATTISKKLIEIGTFKADFTESSTKICESSSITFTDISKSSTGNDNALSWSWNFGDNQTSISQNPNHVYTTAGIYPVTLTTKSANGCSSTATYNNLITVGSTPAINFTADVTGACKAPLTVHFNDQTLNVKSRLWNFGDGFTDVTQQPTHIYTNAGVYNISLQEISNEGCSNTLVKPGFIKIQGPQLNFTSGVNAGCKPLTVNFVDHSDLNFPLKSRIFYFGTNNATSNQALPIYTYSDTGIYNVSLVIEDMMGCKDSIVKEKFIMVGDTLSGNFTAVPTTICHNSKVQFKDLTGGGKYVDTWLWDFGKTEGTSTERNPLHTFNTDTGKFTVTLISQFHGCPDTVIKKDYIKVLPSRSIFYAQDLAGNNDSIGCVFPYTAKFKNYSIEADSSYWNFGDNSPIVKTTTETAVNHNYLNPGFYPVTLITVNKLNNCRDTLLKTDPTYGGYIKISDLTPNFFQNINKVCQYKTIQFKDTSSYSNTKITSWQWYFGDNTSSTTNIASVIHPFNLSGVFSTKLVIQDALGCKDSLTKTNNDTINKLPSPRFIVNKTDGCKPLTVSFSDKSVPAKTIAKWNWDFGDHTSNSFIQNPTHIYYNRGIFSINLTITDTLGCDSTLIVNNLIKPTFPYPGFKIPTFICRYSPLNIVDTSNGTGLNYFWTFGDGTTSNLPNPSHYYKNIDSTTVFDVTLKLTDINICDSSITKQIKVSQPKTDFNTKKFTIDCPPLIAKFYTENSSKDITKYIWDLGDASNRINTLPGDTVTKIYETAGKYLITLYAINKDNCYDTIKSDTTKKMNYISINGPSGTFSVNPLNICSPALVKFKANTLNTAKYKWFFEDGSDTTTTIDSVVHIYKTGAIYYPSLIIEDSKAKPCQIALKSVTPTPVISADVHFSMSQHSSCQNPAIITFTDSSTILPKINSYTISYNWDFGDNTTGSGSKINHTFNSSKNYTIRLKVKIDSCEYSSSPQTFTIKDKPVINFKNLDSLGCNPLKVHFNILDTTNSNIKKWSWNFNDGTPLETDYNPVHTFTSTGNYNIVLDATFANGCTFPYSSKKLISVNPLPVANISAVPNPVKLNKPVIFNVSTPDTSKIKKWFWDFGDGTQSNQHIVLPHIYSHENDYFVSLQVTSTDSCVNTDSLKVVVAGVELPNLPNAFVPFNGDEHNNVFFKGMDTIKNIKLTIINRWGQVLYEGEKPWDGYYKGQQVSPGTYFYIILIDEMNGQPPVRYTGPVTLIRK